MRVEIAQDGRVLFPVGTDPTNLVSGCDFHLDPGTYKMTLLEPGADPASARQRRASWIRVVREPIVFDLRAKAPGTREDLAELHRALEAMQKQIADAADTNDKTAERLTPLEDGMLMLLEQFTLLDKRGKKPVVVREPFQWLADRVREMEKRRE
jgi:hypothetical protein